MKKFLAISLAVVYLAVSSGVVVNIHYCMGKLADIGLGHSEKATCGQCGMENDGCCHDDVKVIKIQDTHSFTSIPTDFAKLDVQLPTYPDVDFSADIISLSTIAETAHAPPGKGQVPLCIKNCVFRI